MGILVEGALLFPFFSLPSSPVLVLPPIPFSFLFADAFIG